jgi:hypothetical protein
MTAATSEKVKGPASCVSSIEAKSSQPVALWLTLIAGQKHLKHMNIVNWLKSEHALGHGHANALVAHALSPKKV